jgi:surface protein
MSDKNKIIMSTKYLENISYRDFIEGAWRNYAKKINNVIIYPRGRIDTISNKYEYESLTNEEVQIIVKSLDMKKFAFFEEFEQHNSAPEILSDFLNYYCNQLSAEKIIPRTKIELRRLIKFYNEDSVKALGIWGLPNDWLVILIDNMQNLFKDMNRFNEYIGDWDTSNVTTMNSMFYNATMFNNGFGKTDKDEPNTLNWDVSKVISTQKMFKKATKFNSYIGSWRLSSVVNMEEMFNKAYEFNNGYTVDISIKLDSVPGNYNLSWGDAIGNVKNCNKMFADAHNFNQDISGWIFNRQVSMDMMFYKAYRFNSSVSNWFNDAFAKIISMKNMFMFAFEFNNGYCNMENDTFMWNTDLITSFEGVFAGAINFNCNINNWNTENVKSMANMFRNAVKFNKDLNNWNMKNVTNVQSMFKNAKSFNKKLDAWEFNSIINMRGMFESAQSFNQNISNWHDSTGNDLKSIDNMFKNAVNFNNGDIQKGRQNPLTLRVSNIKYFYYVFSGAESFDQKINWMIGAKTKEMVGVFKNAFSFTGSFGNGFDISSVKNTSYMFANAYNFKGDVSNWDTHNVEKMNNMFENCSSFNSNLSLWNFEKCQNASNMLYGTSKFNNGMAANVPGMWVIHCPILLRMDYTPHDIMGPEILLPNFNQTIELKD